ncbi:MAG: hypothetical protein OSJ52_00425 [Lachnospiraceae bacterium]|jgi:hypothetical protein|nr:hypothetical protein [Lachnospiraceae bacterium]
MAVIFAIGGGAVAVIGAAMAHDDYSDHYSYDDWGEYSDAAERKQRRLEAGKQETENMARDLSGYKKVTVNPELMDETLKRTPAMMVSENEINQDAMKKISNEENQENNNTVKPELQRIEDIDFLLKRIQEIEKEEQKI